MHKLLTQFFDIFDLHFVPNCTILMTKCISSFSLKGVQSLRLNKTRFFRKSFMDLDSPLSIYNKTPNVINTFNHFWKTAYTNGHLGLSIRGVQGYRVTWFLWKKLDAREGKGGYNRLSSWTSFMHRPTPYFIKSSEISDRKR